MQKILYSQNVPSRIKGSDKLIVNGNTYDVYEAMNLIREEEENSNDVAEVEVLSQSANVLRKRPRNSVMFA